MQRRAIPSQPAARSLPSNITIALMSLRLLWVVNLVLGIIFWLDATFAKGVPVFVHIVIGSLLVLCLWYLGLEAAHRHVSGMPQASLVIGVLLVLAGMGPYFNWWNNLPAQIIHLVLAILAIGIAETMVVNMRRTASRARARI